MVYASCVDLAIWDGGAAPPTPPPPATGTFSAFDASCIDVSSKDWCKRKATPGKCASGGNVAEKCQKTCDLCSSPPPPASPSPAGGGTSGGGDASCADISSADWCKKKGTPQKCLSGGDVARRCQKFAACAPTRRRLRRSLPKPLRRRRHHRRPPSKPHRRRRRRRPPWSTTRRRRRHRRRSLPKRRRHRRRRRPLPSRPRHRHRRLDRRPQAAARARLGPASSAATTSFRESIRGWSSSTSASASAGRTGLTSAARR